MESGSGPRKFLAELAEDLTGALPVLFFGFAGRQLRLFQSGCRGGREWLENLYLARPGFSQSPPSRRPLRP